MKSQSLTAPLVLLRSLSPRIKRKKAISDSAKGVKLITPQLLITLGTRKHGKKWKTEIALALGVDRTAVHKWSTGKHKMSNPIQIALRAHFNIKQ